MALPGDVRERDDVRTAADRLTQASGPVDVLVANAERAMRGRNETNGEAVADLYATNFLGAVYAFEAVLPGMLERGAGHIAVVCSAMALLPRLAAVIRTRPARWPWVGISRGSAGLRCEGIAVTVIYPGFVRTEMTAGQRFMPSSSTRTWPPAVFVAPSSRGAAAWRFRGRPSGSAGWRSFCRRNGSCGAGGDSSERGLVW